METQNNPHATCGAHARTTGKACQNPPMGNGRCRMHGGVSSGAGAPEENTNAKTHGLFSKALGSTGREVYEKASELSPDELARDAAEFALAKIAEAFSDPETKGAVALVEEFLEQCVDDERISEASRDRILRRLTEPDIAAMGKALGPIKGLLEVKKAGVEEASRQQKIDEFIESVRALKEDD